MAFLTAVLLGACDQTPDPRQVEGAIGYLAQAVQEDDAARLYRVLDERSRHALISIVADRRASAAVIAASYPEDEQAAALEALGDAADVATPEELFARRCARACRDALAEAVGAPAGQREVDGELVVTTSRGELRFYRARAGSWWGFVWETEALDRERDAASRDLRQIERNAEVFRRRRTLD